MIYLSASLPDSILSQGLLCRRVLVDKNDLELLIFELWVPKCWGNSSYTPVLVSLLRWAALRAFVSLARCPACFRESGSLPLPRGSTPIFLLYWRCDSLMFMSFFRFIVCPFHWLHYSLYKWFVLPYASWFWVILWINHPYFPDFRVILYDIIINII